MLNTHAQQRARERYQTQGNLPFKKILQTIREGKAKCVSFGKGDALIYDVPLDSASYTGTIRVIVKPDLSWVITVVPPQTAGERWNQTQREQAEKVGARRKQLHREFRRAEESDDDAGRIRNERA
jgi:hypothetical protein